MEQLKVHGDFFVAECRMIVDSLRLSGLQPQVVEVNLTTRQGVLDYQKNYNPAAPTSTVSIQMGQSTLIADPISLIKAVCLKYNSRLFPAGGQPDVAARHEATLRMIHYQLKRTTSKLLKLYLCQKGRDRAGEAEVPRKEEETME